MKSTKNKTPQIELNIPREIQKLFEEAEACRICRDQAIKYSFSAKRAIFYAQRAVSLNRKAWNMIYELWPEVRLGKWSYSLDNRVIRPIIEGENYDSDSDV
jgi:hypothetical protein